MLLLAPTGRDAALSAEALRRANLPCVVCSTAENLIGQVCRGAGPAVIVIEALHPEQAAALEAALVDQPAWSDLPLILVAGSASVPKHLHALVARPNTTLLHRPLKVATFITTIRAAVQNRLRQYEVRDLLRRLEDRARQLQRLALELTEIEARERQRLADILHNDLQQILVGAKLRVAGLSKQATHNQLHKAIATLSELLEQAIDRSRSLSHEFNPPMLRRHGLSAGLQWLAKRMHQLHELQVTVDVDPDANPRGDWICTFLYRSAQELLFNVVKHAGVAEAHMSLTLEHGCVVLRVQDRGRGVDPKVLQGDATGLGLLSIQERANLFGGRFEIRSHEGVGSTFTLALPLEQTAQSTVLPETGEAAMQLISVRRDDECRNDTPRLQILLVDDHCMMRSGLRSLLEVEQDLEVIGEANDGAQAAELAARLQPDLILMDVSMPRMDGIKATQLVKARHPAIRVIGLSMLDDEQSASKMRAAGAERYLPKSGPAEDLLAAVRATNGKCP